MALALLPLLLLATPTPIPPLHTYAALHGRPRYTDMFLFSLGMQTPLVPSTLNHGEYPAVAAMTTGYVFRVENQATVMYLQRVGRTGCCVTLRVAAVGNGGGGEGARGMGEGEGRGIGRLAIVVARYVPALALLAYTLASTPIDKPLLLAVGLLFGSRILSIASLRARTVPRAWHGASEPGVVGDLLVLLSRDRWVRLQGLVDDLKAVTSGSWLQDDDDDDAGSSGSWLGLVDWLAVFLVYVVAVVLGGAGEREKCVFVLCVVVAHGLLAWSNGRIHGLIINGRKLSPVQVKKYVRRLDLAHDLIEEMGRDDWAVRLGMVNPEDKGEKQRESEKEKKKKKGGSSVRKSGRTKLNEEVVTM